MQRVPSFLRVLSYEYELVAEGSAFYSIERTEGSAVVSDDAGSWMDGERETLLLVNVLGVSTFQIRKTRSVLRMPNRLESFLTF